MRFIEFVARAQIIFQVLLWAALLAVFIFFASEIGEGVSELFYGVTARIDHAIGYQ